MIRTGLKRIYIGLIFLFLYAPIFTLIVLSFNASKTRAKWEGFSFKWYISLFENEAIIQALQNTLIIAFLSALIATVLGTMACISLQSMKRKTRAVLIGITNIPMLNAEIVTGISLMLLFISLGVTFGFTTILLAHITFNIPYVILSVMPRMKQLNPSTYEAALDLGASQLQAFFKVVFPDGDVILHKKEVDTFIHAIRRFGYETVHALGIDKGGVNLVSREKLPSRPGAVYQHEIEGWFIYTLLSNEAKKTLLSDIAKRLSLAIRVEHV